LFEEKKMEKKEEKNENYYYLEDGLRKIKPYYFEYKTGVKKRWENKKLVKKL
jgi:hypothetical protein